MQKSSAKLALALTLLLSACGQQPTMHASASSEPDRLGEIKHDVGPAVNGPIKGAYTGRGLSVQDFSADPPLRTFYNKPLDSSVASAAAGNGIVADLPATLISYIDRANTSIDLAVYSFSDTNGIADALVRAKNRGVKVRLVMDADNVTDAASNLTTLDTAGIPHIDDNFPGSGGSALMHNKFIILDGQVTWTGSYNLTNAGAYDDLQDVLVINDPNVASAFTGQFNQFWGSNTMTPNATASKFHNQKTDLGAHVFTVGGKTVEVWFAPRDNYAGGRVLPKLKSVIDTADYEQAFNIFAFSDQGIADAMKTRFDSAVYTQGIFDPQYWNLNWSESLDLRGLMNSPTNGTTETGQNPWNPASIVRYGAETRYIHSKMLIVDAQHPASNPTLATGSFNWSDSANTSNDENLVIVRNDPVLANQGYQAVCGALLRAGGNCASPVVISSYVKSPTTSESVTLKNTSSYPIKLESWTIGDAVSPSKYVIPAGTVLAAGASRTFTSLPFGINDDHETLYLKTPDGVTRSSVTY